VKCLAAAQRRRARSGSWAAAERPMSSGAPRMCARWLGPAKLLPGMPATAAYRTAARRGRGSCASSRIARIFGAPVVHHRGRDARSRRGGPGAAHGRPTPTARRPTPRRHPRTGRPARSHHDRPAARLTYPDARNMHVRKPLSSAHSLISWSTSYLMPPNRAIVAPGVDRMAAGVREPFHQAIIGAPLLARNSPIPFRLVRR